MPDRLRIVFSPPAEPGKVDTGLRFTDVLFGFVIRELFLRLQNWSELAWYVRWHLIVGAALVLGSWIGFRRSLNRTTYEVKFFNLPLLRFLVDQIMVILYFRIAVLTPLEAPAPPPIDLAATSMQLLVFVFSLYSVWDVLAVLMAKATVTSNGAERKPKYPKVEDGEMTSDAQRVDWPGLIITVGFLAALMAVWLITRAAEPGGAGAAWLFAAAAFLLIMYRFAKEVRTSWRLLSAAA